MKPGIPIALAIEALLPEVSLEGASKKSHDPPVMEKDPPGEFLVPPIKRPGEIEALFECFGQVKTATGHRCHQARRDFG